MNVILEMGIKDLNKRTGNKNYHVDLDDKKEMFYKVGFQLLHVC